MATALRYEKIEPSSAKPTVGKAYKARDLSSGCVVYLREVCSDESGIPSRIIGEIAFTKSLEHPNIISLNEIIFRSEKIQMIFEHIDETLHDQISNNSAQCGLPAVKTRTYMYQIVSAVAFCHSQGVVHGNITPRNLYISPAGSIKLGSFTSARQLNPWGTLAADFTDAVPLFYACPEILLGARRCTAAIDMWSAGCVLAEMAAGRPPFRSHTQIGQLLLIFQLLGTPTEETWPGVGRLPDYSPLLPRWKPRDPAAAFPGLDAGGVEVLAATLAPSPGRRITAAAALDMPYIRNVDER